MAFCNYGILQNTSGIWDWLAESLNISEWSKKDYAGLQELFWCLAKMRCHSTSCTSALLTLLCPTSSELPAAQSGSAKADRQFQTFLACSLQTGLPTELSGSWPVPSDRTSLLTRHGAGTWVERPCWALVSLGLSSHFPPHLQVFENASSQRQYPRNLSNFMTNKNGTEDPAVPPLDVGF